MDAAVAGEQSGVAAFVAGAGPGFPAGLAGEGAGGALVGEAVAVFVGALAAGVVAVQAGSSWSPGDGVFAGAPGTGPMCGAGMGDDRHLLVVLAGCDTAPRGRVGAVPPGGGSLPCSWGVDPGERGAGYVTDDSQRTEPRVVGESTKHRIAAGLLG